MLIYSPALMLKTAQWTDKPCTISATSLPNAVNSLNTTKWAHCVIPFRLMIIWWVELLSLNLIVFQRLYLCCSGFYRMPLLLYLKLSKYWSNPGPIKSTYSFWVRGSIFRVSGTFCRRGHMWASPRGQVPLWSCTWPHPQPRGSPFLLY